MNEADSSKFVDEIRAADELTRVSVAALHAAVLAARANGVSWQLIGDALGTSRQAAFKRFAPVTTNTLGEQVMSQPVVNLVERTESVFRSLSDGDFATVKSMMTFSCSRVLTKKKVMGVWGEVLGTTGQFESCSDTIIQTRDGRTLVEQLWNQYMGAGVVGQTQLNHEAGESIGRVAFNSNGKIEGLLIVQPGSTNLPF